jgi:hypothetical protein
MNSSATLGQLVYPDGFIRPDRSDYDRAAGRAPRAQLSRRAASHVVADPSMVGTWLAMPTQAWVAAASPLVAAGVITSIEWSGSGVPLIPIVSGTFGLAAQVNQKDELASEAPAVTPLSTDPSTVGGHLNVSRQYLDWSDRSGDLLFAMLDVAAAASLDKWLADGLVSDGTPVADFDAAVDMFDPNGLFSPKVLAASPKWIAANSGAAWAEFITGFKVIADHRLTKPVLVDPLAAIAVVSTPVREQVDEPSVVGVAVGTYYYVSLGVSPGGVAVIG